MLDTFNRLYILSDAFLIELFLLYSIVFAYSYYKGLLLGVVLAVIREYELPLFNVCTMHISYSLGVFQGSFGWF
jgi:hypothetical protein